MIKALDFLREFTVLSVLVRMALAMLLGGMIGLERAKKRRAAGFRTYMLVSLGAALTMLLGQFNTVCLESVWTLGPAQEGLRTDVSRIGAQVINGIGFLGAGTILVTWRGEVKGLTTAAGLWASACMGLAVGAGFYECVILAFALIFFSIRFLTKLEDIIIRRAKNMNVHIEFFSLDEIGDVITHFKSQNIHIYEVDISRKTDDSFPYPSAVFTIRLPKKMSRTEVLTGISDMKNVLSIEEI